ncbi:MAG: preprotein translocase subunit SecA [Kiritimatiellae bacterium]|jgi:preprotein translocase subunit SecA|nr:preprotein translocase subunit SecA [Kiritimatiellia bacterium]
MISKIAKAIFGTKFERDVKSIKPLVARINTLEEEYQSLTDEQLKAKTDEFRGRLENGETLDDILCEAYATVKNACRRLCGTTSDVCGHDLLWNMVPYDVQLIGGIALHQGKIAEMATGEGKTLVATMPLYLNGITGKGVHLITVNDYLAKRDSEWMGYLLNYLGVSVGCIQNSMTPAQRHEEYGKDVTYGTNSEFGFDYLRDFGMSYSVEGQVQRGHTFAIIDEVDSILIDEARTPLIISGPAPVSTHHFLELKPRTEALVAKQKKLCNNLMAEVKEAFTAGNTDESQLKMYQVFHGMPKHKQLLHMLEDPEFRKLHEGIENSMLKKENHDLGRELKEQLYFTIDERSHEATLTDMGCSALNPSDPESYVLPDLVGQMSILEGNTELSEEEKMAKQQEVQKDFTEKSEQIHNVDQLIRAYALYEKDVQYVVQDNRVLIVDEYTGRILPGRRWGEGLHQAVEAKEGVKIERETQTLATITIQNYFRMYKKLAGMTGTAETEAGEFNDTYGLDVIVIPTNRPVRRMDSNDRIFKTQREKYKAIITEITECHRIGQPVLVGTASVDVSELISRMLKRSKIPHNVLNAKNHEREAEIVSRAGYKGAVTIATNMAGRGTDIKLDPSVITVDADILDSQASLDAKLEDGTTIRQMLEENPGGLHVIGSDRHESRRIDRQLRGRCARQGDPGSSRFYVSLEDDLMRLFGSDRIASIMSRLGLEEGEQLEHKWLNRSIETAQKKVEQQNFSIRKRTLEYDDVMNKQREIIYGFRSEIVQSENVRENLYDIFDDVVVETVDSHLAHGEVGIPDLLEWLHMNFPIAITEEEISSRMRDINSVAKFVFEKVEKAYEIKLYSEDPNQINDMERHVILHTIDEQWQDYLRGMDYLRQGVGLRAYGNKDPLVEYKHEAFSMFEQLLNDIKRQISTAVFRTTTSANALEQFLQSLQNNIKTNENEISKVDHSVAGSISGVSGNPKQILDGMPPEMVQQILAEMPDGGAPRRAQPVQPQKRDLPKVGRNDPCPCGSGKKFKNCCGKVN